MCRSRSLTLSTDSSRAAVRASRSSQVCPSRASKSLFLSVRNWTWKYTLLSLLCWLKQVGGTRGNRRFTSSRRISKLLTWSCSDDFFSIHWSLKELSWFVKFSSTLPLWNLKNNLFQQTASRGLRFVRRSNRSLTDVYSKMTCGMPEIQNLFGVLWDLPICLQTVCHLGMLHLSITSSGSEQTYYSLLSVDPLTFGFEPSIRLSTDTCPFLFACEGSPESPKFFSALRRLLAVRLPLNRIPLELFRAAYECYTSLVLMTERIDKFSDLRPWIHLTEVTGLKTFSIFLWVKNNEFFLFLSREHQGFVHEVLLPWMQVDYSLDH